MSVQFLTFQQNEVFLPVKILKSKQLEEVGRRESGGGLVVESEPCCLAQSANCFSLCFSVPLEDELYFNYCIKDLS